MRSFRQRVDVRFEYAVEFTQGIFELDNPALLAAITAREPARRHRAWVAVDSGVAAAWPGLERRIEAWFGAHDDKVTLEAPPLVVAGGEAAKNDDVLCRDLLARFSGMRLDRHAFVVALGGGAVLDALGYAAALTHRGLRLVRLPTTVLAMADSGVGVKNAINAFSKKNFLGTFVPPWAVLCDLRWLRTLSARDRTAGMAEAVKVALVSDGTFFEWLDRNKLALAKGDEHAVAELVERSAELHLKHIAGCGDPFELGSARPLDFGHWAAHKLEAMTEHRLRHGEAVAMGMAIDMMYSARVGACSAELAERVLSLLEGLGFRLWDDALAWSEDGRLRVLEGLDDFREHLGGELTVSLIGSPGRAMDVHEMDERVIADVVATLRAR